jgi:hypothetical protein
LEEIRRQCDGDSLCGWHSSSMTHSMIIFNPGSSVSVGSKLTDG